MEKKIVIVEGGEESLTDEIRLRIKEAFGDGYIVVKSLKEARELGLNEERIVNKPFIITNPYEKDFFKLTKFFLDGKSPIDAIGKKNRWGKHRF